ncbi:MAG: GntR family transcriptional regulator, partial [Chitinophagaceae bacterium]|nr:GntR family transcriptional regulator [Rubrivivax sp.]
MGENAGMPATENAAEEAPDNLVAARPADSGPSFSPLYQQIKGLLVDHLQAGVWQPGQAIPSEMELAARYKVSQGTVRKAIDEMATDNLL